jgi:dihydroorotate dehydrogenase electron transfer subunit
MKKIVPQTCLVAANKQLDAAGLYYSLTIADFKTPRPISPGQFVHIKVADGGEVYFRRAFSIADYDPRTGALEIIYKILGRGTARLGDKKKGDRLDIIGPLGNRFSKIPKKSNVVMVAGGVGFPPLYFYAKYLIQSGHDSRQISFFYGGRTRNDLVELSRIKKLGVRFFPCTDDGSFGFKGFVTKAVAEAMGEMNPHHTSVCGCGPEPMLAALQDLALKSGFDGELSLEAPMPCGVGVCLGCIKPTIANPREYVRVCHDGPVFKLGEVAL